MRHALARVVILLSVTLALANAQCFTRCLVQPAEHAAPPCHSHGKVQAQTQQHDLRQASVTQLFAPVAEITLHLVASSFIEFGELRPPPLAFSTIPLPLRV